jgi:NAD(P)-dependent dehydrogenase (short-subunit alcohol dehydrogenase family)
VHLRGGFHVVRPAFPLMCKAGYGRIVITSSINGLYGNRLAVNYSVAKAGLLGLANVVALEGADRGVKCNAILPGAVTRMSEGIDTSAFPRMEPDMVAPLACWLSHESCNLTGEMLSSMAGRVSRAYVAESPGVYRPQWTIEDIAGQIDRIRSTEAPVIFPVVPSGQMDHMRYSFEMARRGADRQS